MKRKEFVASTAATLLLLTPKSLRAASWPSQNAWARLGRDVGGSLIRVSFPLDDFKALANPNYIGDQPGLTQTLGWADAWVSKPSAYAVAARAPEDIAATIAFARKHNVRLVVKGGGHSYQGTSNAPNSLLLWTRHMADIDVHKDVVTMGSGATWMHAYDAVTTRAGRYVQGGGCTTVGVAGLIQSGGFGSFSKRYGVAAAGLRSAQIVTADSKIRIVDESRDPELFWALKGGGGGSFGLVSSVTLEVHDLPEYFGAVVATVHASSDSAFQKIIRHFIDFYKEQLFDEHWGETVSFRHSNALSISMVSQGLDTQAMKALWKPFFDWIRFAGADYVVKDEPIILAVPARNWWDRRFWEAHAPGAIAIDPRPGHANDWWWAGDGEQSGWFLYGFDSQWLPGHLLEPGSREQLAEALFAATRRFTFSLHFNKGMAGGHPDAVESVGKTAMNPLAARAFALAICADAQSQAYPGVAGKEPDLAAASVSAANIAACMRELRAVSPAPGSYVSESNYFQSNWGEAYWGENAARLLRVKRQYDPEGLFSVHHGIGS